MGRLKYLAGLAAALVLFSGMRAGAAEPALSAKSAALLSGATGAVLWERQGREPLPMASTTKIMTALLALEAAEDLGDPVVTITQEMTEIFVREFGRINQYFGETFQEMFGGGKGELVLEEPDEPLSCGIEIKVQPPGKQVKTITLLSGGEKAFVAIALYFAILKVRPTPFCLLDEIDAALDDRNVERFASYLRNFSSKTQFLIITHRRGTMEAADVLYGVTMQEQGVSRILHLDLNQMQAELGITD